MESEPGFVITKGMVETIQISHALNASARDKHLPRAIRRRYAEVGNLISLEVSSKLMSTLELDLMLDISEAEVALSALHHYSDRLATNENRAFEKETVDQISKDLYVALSDQAKF